MKDLYTGYKSFITNYCFKLLKWNKFCNKVLNLIDSFERNYFNFFLYYKIQSTFVKNYIIFKIEVKHLNNVSKIVDNNYN